MPRREDDDVAPRPTVPPTRTMLQLGGFALALGATLAVFLTDNAQLLRVAVVAVAWAFVLATFAAGRRGTDKLAAAARERELRRTYELELEREVAARHEYELELENELRRETEESMRYELDALRGDIAELSGLRDEVARVSALREDIAGLSGLRDEVGRVAALRDDVARIAAMREDLAALSALRQELGQVAELRADMGRLRAELTEQLSSEMLIERIVMRTQASRLPGEAVRQDAPGRTLDAPRSWTTDLPPQELTGGWPAVRLDEPRETQQFEQVRVERAAARPPVPAPEAAGWSMPSWEPAPADPRPWDAPPATSTFAAAGPPPAAYTPPPPAYTAPPVPAYSPPPVQPDRWSALTDPSFATPDRWSADETPLAPRSRHSAHEAAPPTAGFPLSPSDGRPVPYRREAPPTAMTPVAPPPPAEPPSPLEWLAARALLDSPPAPARPDVPPAASRRRRSDDAPDRGMPATAQRPAAPPPVRIDDRGGYRVAVHDPDPVPRSEPTTEGTRVAEILAANGVEPASGGRRRRRYRDGDEPDDVLARVLRGN